MPPEPEAALPEKFGSAGAEASDLKSKPGGGASPGAGAGAAAVAASAASAAGAAPSSRMAFKRKPHAVLWSNRFGP
jgi:hypothetical protein